MKLFDECNRTYSKRALYFETRFHFLNRSTWPECARIREVLEIWFSRYPSEHQCELAARFRGDRWEYEAAFLELYLHELLVRLTYQREAHPQPDAASQIPELVVHTARGSYERNRIKRD